LRVIVPGGYYSYDSAGKKIWLDYQYYGTTLENIERIKNLTRNKILYDSKLSKEPVTVENGCITHSYQGTEADTDKIQITLRTPIKYSLTELEAVDGVVTLETTGKVLVLPTENSALLPSFNEQVLDPSRLTVAESPFGGLKGAGSPDYAPGTLFVNTGDGIYLQDTSGTNSTKTLTAGKLKELSLLTIDTTAHTITEEFIVANAATSNSPTVIDDCDSTSGWVTSSGTHSEFISENGKLKITGTPSSGWLVVDKAVTLDLSAYPFLSFKMSATVNCKLYLDIQTTSSYTSTWSKYAVYPVTTTEQIFIVPLDAPLNSYRGPNYAKSANYTKSSITKIRVGVSDAGSAPMTYYIDNITADTAKTATIEAQVPNHLSATSLSIYTHNGTAYQLCSSHSLDSTYAQVSQTSANCTFLDSTKLDDVYGAAGAGRAVFPKGSAGETKAGSSGSITYSNNLGTDKRVALKIDLPPSDNGRTNFNKVRLKLVVNYTTDANGIRSATHIFADSTNASYGLQNLSKPWIALYDPATSIVDFYLFSHRPQNLSFKRNESGVIYELNLYPGAGTVKHGQITFTGLTTDSDSNAIPDCLEADINGSVTKFLQNYTMVI
jgi:hypothetical protein